MSADVAVAYQKRIEHAFWAGGAKMGYAFNEVGNILAELEERIANLEREVP